MPQHDVMLELIQRTGPMAVSSANITGMPPATNADQAIEMLGDEVVVVLDAGETPGEQPSTLVDCTGDRPHILREGALSARDIHAALADTGHAFEDEAEDADDDDPEDARDVDAADADENQDDKPLA
jgi:tRNA A37 threonylcarbamoyladenosine synthetase subunit TsaC/SUA5/YrdC